MQCIEKLGSIALPKNLKDDTLKHSTQTQRNGAHGVTCLHLMSRPQEAFDALQETGIHFTDEDRKQFLTGQFLRATPLKMHNDAHIGVAYGILVMVGVPPGAKIHQTTGESFELNEGDVFSIRYRFNHSLEMKEDERLLFISVDFDRGSKSFHDSWFERIANINN
jgi:mannose-6-phosphate isomerase-like protein (cupin superfamily)